MSEFYEDVARVDADQASIEVDMTLISSFALARLVEEVRNDEAAVGSSYDRVHNRHNR
ncbi:YhhA family cyclophane-containing RiPP [Roseateles oligotrophus]|uniref:Uncharacterized protein n=1 Tax=Roseateles oligotrophus TaxID=1769250 RepID=A0ABT2YMR2_9BURK|nr:YhhA family cyclophane-containing RiPP [Roseateles oligotrophus]MCV2371360.1 hypothetical protein [Roseateles oligotrophus]